MPGTKHLTYNPAIKCTKNQKTERRFGSFLVNY
jgi:hypothetical protein